MADLPRKLDHPLYLLLQDENIAEFNKRVAAGERTSLANAALRGLDLRNMDPADMDFSGAYFRSCDLRGIDFRRCNMEGASVADAKISGCYFPVELSADEIHLSLERGTRMRYR